MKKIEELKNYDFHDSLLESVIYEKEKNCVVLGIDFCNWRQVWYDENEDETLLISLIFKDVHNVIIPEITLHSDDIISVEVFGRNAVKIVCFNDIKNVVYEITFNSDSVEIKP